MNVLSTKGFFLGIFLALFFVATEMAAFTPIPPPPYTKTQIQNWLTKAWAGYKSEFILSTGQVIRPENNNDTVSEGQAYAMLFAVQMSDKTTFDKCFAWTEQNLSRNLPGSIAYGGPDNLLAWHWLPIGGVQADGWMAASDADEDYAYALLLAYEKWGQSNYFAKAIAVIDDILAKETYAPSDPDLLFLKPGTWGEGNIYGHQGITINPSYLSPAWYRKFNSYVPDSRWQKLIDGSYYILQVGANSILNPATGLPSSGVGLLPDWAFIDDNGVIYFTGDNDINPALEISGWDACRLPWRIYNDYKFTNQTESRAGSYLNQLKSFYQTEFNLGHQIFATYYYTGSAAVNYTSPAASGLPLLASSFNSLFSITNQTGMPQTALAYILKSAPINPPANNQFSGPDTFQESKKSGVFVAPGDILRYYINSLCLFGLLTAYQAP
jgi:hypothetical protein